MTDYVHDAITDYSAPTDGSNFASAAIAWNNFIVNTMTPSDTLTITFRNAANGGSDDWYLDNLSNAGLCYGALGGRKVTFVIQDDIELHGGGSFNLARNVATVDNDTSSSRINATNIGDTSVTLKTPAEHTRYVEGQWLSVGSVDLQGFGSPHNPRLYDHVQITTKDAGVASNGLINISPAIQNRHLDTLPVFNDGDGFHPDCGGPATIWLFLETYDLDITFNLGENVRIYRDAEDLIYCKARKVTVNAPASSGFGGLGLCPTICQEMHLNGGYNGDGQTEIDKVIGDLHNNGTRWKRVFNQSGIGRSYWTNTVCQQSFELTRKVELLGGNELQSSIFAGPTSFAWCDSLIIRGNNYIEGPWQTTNRGSAIADWEWMGGGIFRAIKENIDAEDCMLMPGAWFCFSGSRKFGKPFRVDSITFDETYFYSHTTLTTYPEFDMGTTGFTVIGFSLLNLQKIFCFGKVDSPRSSIRALNRHPKGRPYGEYTELDITGAHAANSSISEAVNGEFMWMEIDVSRAYTGAQETMRIQLGQFGFFLMNDQTIARPQGLYVNAKETGIRRLESGGSWTGTKTGDNLSAFQGWFMDSISAFFPTDSTGDTDAQQAIGQIRIRSNMGPPVRECSWNLVAS